MKLSDICSLTGWEFRREAEVISPGFVDIPTHGRPMDGRLVFAMNRKSLSSALTEDGVVAILTTDALAKEIPVHMGLTLAQDPRRAFVDGHNTLEQHGFYGPWLPTRIDPSAVIHPSAVIEPEGVVLGPDCRVDAKAVILRGTELGQAVHVMAGAVLGGEGFQSMKFSDAVVDFSHAGGLIVGDRTVIMANAVIARAVFRQATTIGPDCRIGNGAFVSHNCRIGARCLIGHNATVAGNCLVGDGVTIGPGATTIHCLTFGANAAVTAGAVVIRDVPEDTRVSGNFAQSHRQALRRISER